MLAELARGLQYAGAGAVCGAVLFLVAGHPLLRARHAGRLSALHLTGLALLLAGAVIALLAQAMALYGVGFGELDAEALRTVLLDTRWGHGLGARLLLAALLLALAFRRGIGWPRAGVVALLLASFAWTGHGAATPGAIGLLQLVADIAHLLAAGVWLGMLLVFVSLALGRSTDDPAVRPAFADTLAGFSGLGSALVAVLVVTGLVNSWVLVGIERLGQLPDSAYGIGLLLKTALFGLMLGLAALNRFRLTPALADPARGDALPRLRASLLLETAAGLAILAIVSAIGMMEPPAAL